MKGKDIIFWARTFRSLNLPQILKYKARYYVSCIHNPVPRKNLKYFVNLGNDYYQCDFFYS